MVSTSEKDGVAHMEICSRHSDRRWGLTTTMYLCMYVVMPHVQCPCPLFSRFREYVRRLIEIW